VIILHQVGVPALKKALILSSFVLPACMILSGCGNSAPSSGQTSGLTYKVFLSNNVSAGTNSSGVNIVNAITDVRAANEISAGSNPGMMVVTPNNAQTLVFSGTGTLGVSNTISLINNATETSAASITLPGYTQSFVVSPDSSTAYVAVPTAQVIGGTPGVVLAIGLVTGAVTGQANVPAVQYLSISNGGNRILGFMPNSNQIAVITPSQIGIGNAVSYVGGFDRPVAAFFSSDDTTAYVLNCGAECGGTQASVQQLNLVANTAGTPLPACTTGSATLCGASVGLIEGTTMYVAGTPPYVNGQPQQPCTGETTASTSCGLLTVIDLSTNPISVQSSGIVIPDGYHTAMAMAANGQLFIGSTGCTEIASATETRGCLSIYNTLPSTTVGTVAPQSVFIPPQSGDATGLQPIGQRTVTYVTQGGSLYIYDASFDGLAAITNNPNNPGKVLGLVGYFLDVKLIDVQ
jgi:hypothetical protein